MKLILKTNVKNPPRFVFENFNEKLFHALTPPWVKIKSLKFVSPEAVGEAVQLELKLIGLVTQKWRTRITAVKTQENFFGFEDVGERLPFPLKRWHHKHLILPHKSGSTIIDDITYSSGTILTDLLLWPAMWLQFAYRKKVYRKFFLNGSR